MSYSPASGQRGRLAAPRPARCAGIQKPEPAEAPGRVRRDPPGTRAVSALGTRRQRERRGAGLRFAIRGMPAGLELTWVLGARGWGGGRDPLGDVPLPQPLRSSGTRGGRGDRPLPHSLRPRAEPRLRARPRPLPSPRRPAGPLGCTGYPALLPLRERPHPQRGSEAGGGKTASVG